MLRFTTTILISVILLLNISITAEVPQLINYQGVLRDADGQPVLDGNYSVTFRIYGDSLNGETLWEEGQA